MWALGLASAASRTTNPWLLALVVLVASVTVLSRRTDAPWAMSFRYYLLLGLLVITLRVFFRVLFGGGLGTTTILELPQIPLPDWAAGVTLLGPLTTEALLSGLYDGMRLAAIIICVGAANSLANPRRLLASLPPALYEVGTALVIALSLFPQLAESVQRVRQARRLRGDPGRGVGALRRIVVPVLEDALERSLSLAASMDARGYGRAGDLSVAQRRTTGVLLVSGLLGLVVGTYAFLDSSAPRVLVWPMLVTGLVLSATGFAAAGRRVRRTRYRPDRWRFAEFLTAATGVASAAAMAVAAGSRPDVVVPFPGIAPPLSVLALAAVLVALLPAFATPMPVLHNAPRRADSESVGHREQAALR